MPSPFRRTLRSLEADGTRAWTLQVMLVTLFLAGWAAWFFLARVSVYAVTPQARIEAEEAAHPLQAPVAGRVTLVDATLEEWVERGDVLFELGAEEQARLLAAKRDQENAIETEIRVLGDKIQIETGAVTQSSRVGQAEIDEALARYQEAQTALDLARQKAERSEALAAQGLLSDSEAETASSEAEQSELETQARAGTLRRLRAARELSQSDRRSDVGELRRETAELEGDLFEVRGEVAQLEHQLELRRVRAPTAGRIGELARVEVGSFVDEGDRLGVIVPEGDVKVVADFSPASAVGRISRGQTAKIRLDGFPSIQYGALTAVVSRVSSELRDGRIRVELDIAGDTPTGLPIQHGLPGTAEVQVERISPAAMMLRAAGKIIGRPAASAMPPAEEQS
ncbi:MAG: HlyD family efflux transporter periplasmic adaptor subunit [Acidobacteriota bacterium]|nr:HlyD family efflux transporter periplasmic adaptor subunit [Acidobacteriota bacterium]